MGMKFFRRQKSSSRAKANPTSEQLPPLPTPTAVCAESIDNTTITTKQTAASKKKNTNNGNGGGGANAGASAAAVPYHPNFDKETRHQLLPPLGLTTDEYDDIDDDVVEEGVEEEEARLLEEASAAAFAGYACGATDNLDDAIGTTGTGGGGGGGNSINESSLQSDSVFAGLSKIGTSNDVQQLPEEIPVTTTTSRSRHCRDPSEVGASKLVTSGAPTELLNSHYHGDQPSGFPLDPPEEQHSGKKKGNRRGLRNNKKKKDPNSTPSSSSSRVLRVAMRREISKHRNTSSLAGKDEPIVNQVRNSRRGGNKSREENGSGGGGDGSQAVSKAVSSTTQGGGGGGGSSKASSSSKRRARKTSKNGRGTTIPTNTVVAATAVAGAAVGAGAAAAAAPSRMGLSVKRQLKTPSPFHYEEDPTIYDDDDDDEEYVEFPKGDADSTNKEGEEEEEEENSLQDATSFCSCGSNYVDYDIDDDDADEQGGEDDTKNDNWTYNDDEGTIDSYGETLSFDGTMDSYHSRGGEDYYDEEEDECSRKSVDPPGHANDGTTTWASWFGFGDDNYDESLLSLSHNDDESTLVTRASSQGEEDGESIEERNAKLVAKEDFNKIIAMEEAKAAARMARKKKKKMKKNGDGGTNEVQSESGSRDGVEDDEDEERYDREGRPLSTAKPLVRRPSFKKSWKKLKNGKEGDGNKTIASEDTPATVSLDRSKGSGASSKSRSSSKERKKKTASEQKTTPPTTAIAANNSNAKNTDGDIRQRDIYCEKHGDVENLTIRQYEKVPTPNAPDHILIKVEASTVSSQDCIIRLKGDPTTQPNPSVPGFHIVGTVHSIGSDVNATSFRHGDRIAALLQNGGGNAKYISLPMKSAILLPETATHDDVICLVANYMTAYQCLKLAKKDGAPLTNANVLITGGSGPVGQALVELALREGAKVYATAHKMHEEHLTKLGAKWFAVNPKKWLKYLEGKIDVVIDSLCVDGYESSYRALTPDGILVCNTGNDASGASLLHLKHQNDPAFCHAFDDNGLSTWWSGVKAKYIWNRAIFYDLNTSYEKNPKMFAHELHYLICKLDRGEIMPKVAGKVSLNQVPKAQKLIEKGLPNGTVVCLPWKKLDPKQKVKVEKADLNGL